jgi:hypothetical protein
MRIPRLGGTGAAAPPDAPPPQQLSTVAAPGSKTTAPPLTPPPKPDQQLQQDQCAKALHSQQGPPRISCTADTFESLPPHILQRLQQLPARHAADPGALMQELRSCLTGSGGVELVTFLQNEPAAPLALQHHHNQQQHQQQHQGAWQVPRLPTPATAAHGPPCMQQHQQQALFMLPLSAGGGANPNDNNNASSSGGGGAGEAALRFHTTVVQQLDDVGWGHVIAMSQVGAAAVW